ncbi:MAG: S-layer homology domain-containing protein [Clostridia bacterium]|nr:S-layer homology domain-containing protein [Clostridia bacterium]
MKKVLSLVLTAMMVLSFAATAFAGSFSDVDSNYAWAEDAIENLSEKGIVTGYEDGTFMPGKSITRQEAIALFSRAMGASEEVNEPIVNLAYGIYEADIAGCEDSFAAKQGAYLIYRKVLTADEVKEYLLKDNRNLELKRYEAATLIAKALGADAWLANNKDYDVEFDDRDEIPARALGYVYYATALGIMNGMGDNKFGPNETVTRAQISVMIQRILDTMEFTYLRGMISNVDTLMNNLSIKTDDGNVEKFGTGNSGAIYLDGNKVALTDLEVGMVCVFTFSKGALYQIDAITYEGEETVVGAYRGKTTTNAGTTITLADVNVDEPEIRKYKLAANAVVEYEGEAANLNDIKNGAYVTLKISGGLGVSVSAEAKEKTISNLTVSDIETSINGVVISFESKSDDEFSYSLADDVTFQRNGVKADLSTLAIGDEAQITVTYGLVTGIKAMGKQKNTEGAIEEITISQNTSYITITKAGSTSKFALARDCEVLLQGESADIYDLRLGAYVKLTVTSETVTKIESEAVSESLTVTGTIKTINAAYGLVMVEYEGKGGDMVEKQLFLSDSTKILDSRSGKMLTIKNLKAGNVITAAGTEKLGVYEVSSLMVLQ